VLLATFCTAWGTTLRRWSQHDSSTKRLVLVSIAAFVGVSGVLLTVRALHVNWRERDALSGLWFKYGNPFYHHQMHLLEAANFVPWIVPILLCFLALPLARQVRTRERAV